MTLAALTIATAVAARAPNRAWFSTAGITIGAIVGPNQSASRSLMARDAFVPKKRQAEFFGLFAFSGKVTSFMGPILLGTVTAVFQSERAGVATVILFFVVGWILMATVNERRGIEAAGSR